MAPRASWKGYLRLSLGVVPDCPLPASSLVKVSVSIGSTGNPHRLKQLNVDSETGDVVRREDIARGFEVTKGENEDIDAVQIESTRTIEIDQFVPRGGDR